MNIVLRFVVQMVIGAFLFAVVAAVAYILWLGTRWLEQQGVPDHIGLGARALTELLFGLDALCFVVFTIGETIKLVRDIIRDVRG
jgi:hypothetical protein